MKLQKNSHVEGNALHLTLSGELTGDASVEFRSWITELLGPGFKQVRLDCAGIRYLDSSGLGALIHLRKKTLDGGGELFLSNVSGWLLKFLKVTGLHGTFCDEGQTESEFST